MYLLVTKSAVVRGIQSDVVSRWCQVQSSSSRKPAASIGASAGGLSVSRVPDSRWAFDLATYCLNRRVCSLAIKCVDISDDQSACCLVLKVFSSVLPCLEGLLLSGALLREGLILSCALYVRAFLYSRSDLGCQTVVYNLDRFLILTYTRLPVSISSHRTGRLRGRSTVLAWRLMFSNSR